jgi:acetate---CoA ligase (ADP-forming)
MTAAGGRLRAFLAPRSIALVGIPGDEGSPLARPLFALRRHGFTGAVYPVNPRRSAIGGERCYPALAALPEPPDLAWIAVPGHRVPAVLDECIAVGIRHAVVVSAGFAESDASGAARQAAIAERARIHGLTVLGPNSIGFVNAWERVPLSFSTAVEVPALIAGDVAIVSQSGGLGGAVFNRLQDRHVGISYLVSTGNEADVRLDECLEFLVEDERTSVIVLIVEGVRDGQAFRRAAARALEADKPVVALRLGLTAVGGRLARSHTGAIVGSARAWDGVARQLGIVTVDDLADVPDAVIWSRRAGARHARRVAVITSSGGAAVHVADRLGAAGFELPPLPPAAERALREVLPAYATPANPLDITAGLPEATFAAAVQAVARSGGYDALLMPLTMLAPEQARVRVGTVAELAGGLDTPVAFCWLGGSLAGPGIEAADRHGLASFTSVGGAVAAMAAARTRAEARERWLGRGREAAPVPLDGPGRGVLPHGAVLALCERFGIAMPPQALVKDAAAAVSAARRLGYPVALKAVGADFLHKSDRQALRLGIGDAGGLERAVRELEAVVAGSACEGFLVQRMVEGAEVAVGVVRDETFGPLLMVGPGGTAVELSEEHRCLPLPATAAEIRTVLDAVPSFRTFRGYRHVPPRDRHALVETIEHVARLALALGPALAEIDVNPVMVGPEGKGAWAVDVVVVMDE